MLDETTSKELKEAVQALQEGRCTEAEFVIAMQRHDEVYNMMVRFRDEADPNEYNGTLDSFNRWRGYQT